jgi:hypothetical protein
MPTHLRLRCAFQVLDANPKNTFVINPTFRRQMDINDPLGGVDAQALCTDLATALDTWYGASPGQLSVKAYNIEGAKPNLPLATKTLRVGSFYTPFGPPQAACCLSYYAVDNLPRRRGRLYVPMSLLKPAGTAWGTGFILGGERTKVAALVPLCAGLGGANVDWGVWSSVEHAFHKATNWFVNDSFDIIRSRAFAEQNRDKGTTGG